LKIEIVLCETCGRPNFLVECSGKNGVNLRRIDFVQRHLCMQSNTEQLSRNQEHCEVLIKLDLLN